MHYLHLTDLKTETPRDIESAKVIRLIRGGVRKNRIERKERGGRRKEERRQKQALSGTRGEM